MNRDSFPSHWIAHDKKVRPYHWSHRILSGVQSVLGLAVLYYFIDSGRAEELEWRLQAKFGEFWVWIFYFAVIVSVWKFVTLPFSFGHYWIERRFGLSKQNIRSWFADLLKGVGVAAVLGFIVLSIVWLTIAISAEWWWLLCSFLLFLFSVLLAQLAPVLLLPLFYKLVPMETSPLKQRLLDLAQRFGITVQDVYHLGLGEKTEKGNAAFVGVGKTKRIIIGDTLYQKYPSEEVEAVFAHELGHQVHGDLVKGICFGGLSLLLGFYLANLFSESFLLAHFKSEIARPFGFFLFMIALTVVQMPFGILQTWFSRWRERLADDFAWYTVKVRDPLAAALEKLTIQNYGTFVPNPVWEFLTHSHPAPWRRIMREPH